MNIFLILFFGGVVIALIFLNIYFRMKVIKEYKYLIKNEIEFSTGHIFNPSRMEKEIIPNYPGHEEHIRNFGYHIRHSLKWTLGIIALLSLIGAVLKYMQA